MLIVAQATKITHDVKYRCTKWTDKFLIQHLRKDQSFLIGRVLLSCILLLIFLHFPPHYRGDFHHETLKSEISEKITFITGCSRKHDYTRSLISMYMAHWSFSVEGLEGRLFFRLHFLHPPI